MSWVDLSRDRYIALPKLATPAGNTFGWGLLFTWDKRDSPVKKLCWMRAWRRRWHLVSPTLYIIIVYRVNLNKLSQNFVEATRTTTTNCRVSFTDLDLIFSTNFRIVFLPHTNTVIYWNRTVVLSQSLGYLCSSQERWQVADLKHFKTSYIFSLPRISTTGFPYIRGRLTHQLESTTALSILNGPKSFFVASRLIAEVNEFF